MAYFSNNTDGAILDHQCHECSIPDNVFCPIMEVQIAYNYKQFTDGEPNQIADPLNNLVNKEYQCRMKKILDNLR